MLREHPDAVRGILVRHGAIIEAKAAPLTPVDTGLLRRATASRVEDAGSSMALTIENRMEYAAYQHYTPGLRHKQPQARDRFIEIPFTAEVPRIVEAIIERDMQEATE